MGKMINFAALIHLVLLVSTGLLEQGEAQAQGCEWQCKNLPNFKCWMGTMGHKLCDDYCKYEGAVGGVCVSEPYACLCRNPKAGCS